MRLLNHHVLFGIYIGDDIRLYYDNTQSLSLPEPLFIIEMTKYYTDGAQFVELFRGECTFIGETPEGPGFFREPRAFLWGFCSRE